MTNQWYATPGSMTTVPADLPPIDDIRGFVQGCFVHTAWAPAYGVDKVHDERQTRSTVEMLDAVRAIDVRPLSEPREPEQRAGVVCRHFSTLAAALLRRDGVPARARVGFATYFEKDKYVDHWIVEQHDGTRWVQRDFQLDDLQRKVIGDPFDPDDLPRGAFLSGGEAWQTIRAGHADPNTFGIFEFWGSWFVRHNVVRDLAALNKVEMLPWDAWGVMIEGEDDTFVDELAQVTVDADLDSVRRAYDDDRVRMAGRVTSFTERGPKEESVQAPHTVAPTNRPMP
jgi:transglutaminase superfamily protein